MELEALCRAPRALAGGFVLRGGILDFAPLFAALLDDRPRPREGSELFHGTLIEGSPNGSAPTRSARPAPRRARRRLPDEQHSRRRTRARLAAKLSAAARAARAGE